MSLPLANQVRQIYVVSSLADAEPASLGQLQVCGVAGKYLYFKHFGQGGLTSSDKIDVNNIRYIKQTAGADLSDKLKTHVVTVQTAVAGQVYEIKLRFLNYIGQGAQDFTYRIGTYRAKTSDAAADIAAGLAASLQATLGLEKGADATDPTKYKEPIATVTVSDAAITIKEVEQYWELGKFSVAQMPIEVGLNGIVTDDNYFDYEWATIALGDPTDAANSGKKIADLEYFCMGNRADQYRGMGWPRTAESKLMVDPTEDYDLIDIHYFFQGTGVSVQQSEKEITLVVPAENETILAAITALLADENGTPKLTNNEGAPARSTE